MRRRLPLMDAVPPAQPVVAPTIRSAAPLALGVADAVGGGDSFAFACELASELGRARVPVRIALLSYEALPALPQRSMVDASEPAYAISRHLVSADGALEPALDEAAGTISVLVGAPAVGSFSPALTILIAGERAVASMPPYLRALRPTAHLMLPAPRPGLAASLAERLLACGFLPRP